MASDIALSTALLHHRYYSRGAHCVADYDLTLLAEAYPDLRPVFEELQYLRRENAELEIKIANGD